VREQALVWMPSVPRTQKLAPPLVPVLLVVAVLLRHRKNHHQAPLDLHWV
jgi:hypothetical protein